MNFKLLQDITESKLFTSVDNLSRYTLKDIADLTFLYFITMYVLNAEFESASQVKQYALKTISYGNFDEFRYNSNDLYLLLHVLIGAENSVARTKLRNHEANITFDNRLRLQLANVKTFLRGISGGRPNPSMLYQFENVLQISNSNYKSCRRLIQDWLEVVLVEKQLCITRLLQAFRARAPKSELLPILSALAKSQDLELHGAINPEIDTQPDMTSALSKLAIGTAAAGGAIAVGLVRAYHDVYGVKENASAGATGAGSVATAVTPLGGKVIKRNPKKGSLFA